MASDRAMAEALSAMLEEGETLLYPIFGYMKFGGLYQYAYFAFTETHFLIACVTGEQVTSTERIPLQVTSVSVERSVLFSEHTVRILFGRNREYTVCAAPRVLKIKSQKENFPQFLAHLRSLAQKPERSSREMQGEKIRWQYFNTYIYLMLGTMHIVPLMLLISAMKKGNFDILGILSEMSGAIPFILIMYACFVGPAVILSVFNRLFFGKTVAVVDPTTLYLNNREVPLSQINEIVYHPRILSKHTVRSGRSDCFSYAEVFVRTKADNTETVDIVHFPVYGLWKIRKYNPQIRVKFDWFILHFLLWPTVLSALIVLLLG